MLWVVVALLVGPTSCMPHTHEFEPKDVEFPGDALLALLARLQQDILASFSSGSSLPKNPLSRDQFALTNVSIGEPAARVAKRPSFDCLGLSATFDQDEIASVKRKLPIVVQPQMYTLLLGLDPNRDWFLGSVAIDVNVQQSTDVVYLHAGENLCIVSFKVSGDHPAVNDATMARDPKNELLRIDFASEISSGTKIRISFDFSSSISVDSEMHGLYASSYRRNGKKYMTLSTQFEPLDARKMLPCFDEPDFKAKFSVTIVTPRSAQPLTVLSNMPPLKGGHIPEAIHDGFKWIGSDFFNAISRVNYDVTVFDTTPPMSTYLLAVVVGTFDKVSAIAQGAGVDRSDVTVTCYSEVGASDHVTFALGEAVRSLQTFSEYFNQPFSLPKMDLVAIPNFAAGAMENWGLVTYTYSAYYVDTNSLDIPHKLKVALVVWHENAHQWFGNLVTLSDWDELYLNEGFAAWLETFSAESVMLPVDKYPTWGEFSLSTMQNAMNEDSMMSTHALAQSRSADGAATMEMFDSVSYDKGASILRMLHSFLEYRSSGSFRTGLQQYVNKYKFSNSDSEGLWREFQAASGENVPSLMGSWVHHVGFPYVTMSVQPNCQLKITQQRFTFDGEPQGETTWQIPLFITMHHNGKSVTTFRMFDEEQTTVTCDQLLRGSEFSASRECCFDRDQSWWLKANWHQSSLVRVRYMGVLLDHILHAIYTLPEVDRGGVILDLFAFNRKSFEIVSISTILGVIENMAARQDVSHIVWKEVFGKLIWIDGILCEHKIFEEWRQFVRAIVQALVNVVGLEHDPTEPARITIFRSLLLAFAVSVDHEPSVQYLAERFQSAQDVFGTLDVSAMFRAAVRTDPASALPRLKQIVVDSDILFVRHARRALAEVATKEDMMDVIDFVFENVAVGDFMSTFAWMIDNYQLKSHVLNYIEENFEKLLNRLSGYPDQIVRLFDNYSSTESKQRIEAMFNRHIKDQSDVARTIGKTLEMIELRQKWAEQNAHDLATFLRQ